MITAVMAHASFSGHRRELLPRIEESWGDYLHDIVEDRDRNGAWPTVRSCWEKGLELTSEGHILAAQDDFELVPGAAELMNALSNRFPDRILAFRWPQASCSWLWHMSKRDNKFWARVNHSWTGGAVALPINRAGEFLEWAKKFDRIGGYRYEHQDDARLDMWTIAARIPVWRLRWSLMRHVGDDYSVVRNGTRSSSPEMGLVQSAAEEIPSLHHPGWDDVDVHEYTELPEAYRLNASTMLKGRQAEVGL